MTFKKGESGNISGRPKIAPEIKALALEKSPQAFAKIVSLVNSIDPKVAMAAAKEILDRAYGKPAQGVELTGKNGGDITVNVNLIPADVIDSD